ncbi:F-box protein [Melia azedarach]|uniref:F-box protein n=1 Tax=Melia azedarach TaxID=155640 RepID=A0ACC1X1W1_MELAZ|nr:F-box protein [Melia azedarach]
MRSCIGILLRLPARDLISMKRVCKTWKEFIDSREFARAHLKSWKSRFEIILFQGVFPALDFVSLDIRTNTHHQLPLRKLVDETSAIILDSLDGLILFGVPSSGNKLYVCNPLTQKLKLLGLIEEFRTFYKLVFDSALQKYKVIGFCYQYLVSSKYWVLILDDDEEVKPPVWREVESRFWHCLRVEFAAVLVTGFLCWIAHTITENREDREVYIQTMDIVGEEFKHKIKLPIQSTDNYSIGCKLLQMENVEGCLCVAIPESQTELGIWILEDWNEPSWIKKYNICHDPELGKPLHFSKRFSILYVMDAYDSEKVKFIVKIHGELYSYSLKCPNPRETCEGFPKFTYVPSLMRWD